MATTMASTPEHAEDLSIFLLCRSGFACEVIGLYLVRQGAVQLIFFLAAIRESLKRKSYRCDK